MPTSLSSLPPFFHSHKAVLPLPFACRQPLWLPIIYPAPPPHLNTGPTDLLTGQTAPNISGSEGPCCCCITWGSQSYIYVVTSSPCVTREVKVVVVLERRVCFYWSRHLTKQLSDSKRSSVSVYIHFLIFGVWCLFWQDRWVREEMWGEKRDDMLQVMLEPWINLMTSLLRAVASAHGLTTPSTEPLCF